MRKGVLGQSLLDYVLLFTIVVAVLLIMGYYVRNSLSGKYREAADVFGQGEVYIPGTRR
jgi:nitrogen fixation protein FixH